jgi:hypothetical protein
MAHLLLNSKGPLPRVWREWGAAAISPALGFNRLAFGSRFDAAFADNDPLYYGRLQVGGKHVLRDDTGGAGDLKRNMAEVDFATRSTTSSPRGT